MGSLARQWTLSNFDRLVKRIQWSPALDHLVTLGFFEPTSEDYQDIRAGGTDIKSARLLIEKVLERSENAVEDFRSFVLKQHPGLEWKDASVCEESLKDGRASTSCSDDQRDVRKRRASATSISTNDQVDAQTVSSDGCHGNPRPLIGLPPSQATRSASKRQRKKAAQSRARTRNVVITVAGIVVVAVIASFWPQLRQAISPSVQPEVGQPRLQRGGPKEVIDFRNNALATLIHARAHDRAFLWLTEEDPQPVENVHVNLVITTKAAQMNEEQNLERGRKTPAIKVPDHNPMHGKIPVDVADVFNPAIDDSATNISSIILRAEAGMGKTFTFAKTMPLRWLKNSSFWPDLDLVFVIHLGDPQVQVANRLEDVFLEQFAESLTPAEKGAIMSFISKNPQRVLLVCDAFDEGENFVPPIIHKLIRGTLLPGLRVLVTSRPCIGIRKLAKFAHRQLELLGIAKEDLPKFIQKQLRREENADKLARELTGQLNDRKDMVNLMGSPLIASLVCGFFAQEQYLPGSSTELYQRIIINLLRRANEKTFKGLLLDSDDNGQYPHILKLSGKAGDILDQLGQLALFGLRNGKVVFKKEEVDQFCSRAILEIGILMRLTKTGRALTPRDHVAFFHLTFMEFFAGYALSKKCLTPSDLGGGQILLPPGCVSANLKEFPMERERNIIVWFFASGLWSLLDTGFALHNKWGAGQGVIHVSGYREEVEDTVTTLGVVQQFLEVCNHDKRVGTASPVECEEMNSSNIISSLKQLVREYPVLQNLITAPSSVRGDHYDWMSVPVAAFFSCLRIAAFFSIGPFLVAVFRSWFGLLPNTLIF